MATFVEPGPCDRHPSSKARYIAQREMSVLVLCGECRKTHGDRLIREGWSIVDAYVPAATISGMR